MDSFSEDFKTWMDVKQFTAETLAPVIGKSAGTIANWRSIGVPERSSVRQFLTDFMANYTPSTTEPETSTIRIEFDDEELDIVSTAAGIVDTPIREFIRRAAVHQARVDAAKSTPAKVSHFPVKPHILAAAGSPISAEVTDWDGSNDTVLVKINGLSMSPKLNDGDVIAMKHKRISRNPFMKKCLIYLVEYDGGFTVKRYNTRPARPDEMGEEWVEKGKVKVLQSINPDFPEIIIKQPVEWVAWLDKA